MTHNSELPSPVSIDTSRGGQPNDRTSLSSWNGIAVNLRERASIAVTARSPIERLVEYKKHRGFANLPFVSDVSDRWILLRCAARL